MVHKLILSAVFSITLSNVVGSALASNENSAIIKTSNLPEIAIANSNNVKDNSLVVENSSLPILNKGSDDKSYIDLENNDSIPEEWYSVY